MTTVGQIRREAELSLLNKLRLFLEAQLWCHRASLRVIILIPFCLSFVVTVTRFVDMKLRTTFVTTSCLSFVAQAVPLFELGNEIDGLLDLGSKDSANELLPSSSETIDQDTDTKWDFIIVGGGTAGIVVADRLSEAGKSTLLLELGGPSYGITGGRERPGWLNGTELSRVDVPGLCESATSFETAS